MDATSDDLLKPLGVDPSDGGAARARPAVLRILAAVLASGLLGAGVAVWVASNPFNRGPAASDAPLAAGKPQTAAVERSGAAEPDRRPEADGAARGQDGPVEMPRRTAAEVETASGVSVVRPNGAAAPAALVIRVPDDATALNPAPDPRLVERTRRGVLPKVGADGSRSLAVYARPIGALPGGARPVARIAVLVGGLGLNQSATADAITKLPAPVTLAFAPYGADLERAATQARDGGHEIMLQVPMEPFDYPANDPGPHTLTTKAKPQENIDRLHWAMSRFAGYTGLVNHMGGKLTADEAALAPILREIGGRGLAFLDDGSSPRSLVGGIGASAGTPTARGDMVLDGAPRAEAIDQALSRLESIARERGFAIGTASALPVTIERLARWTRSLEARGILLVPVSAVVRRGDPR